MVVYNSWSIGKEATDQPGFNLRTSLEIDACPQEVYTQQDFPPRRLDMMYSCG